VDPEVRGDSAEQLEQPHPFVGSEAVAGLLLVLPRGGRQPAEDCRSLGCQVEGPSAPVRAVDPAHNPPMLLHRIEKGHHCANGDEERLGDRLLALAGLPGQIAQHGEVPRLETSCSHELCELPGVRLAKLGQHVANAVPERLVRSQYPWLRVRSHSVIVLRFHLV